MSVCRIGWLLISRSDSLQGHDKKNLKMIFLAMHELMHVRMSVVHQQRLCTCENIITIKNLQIILDTRIWKPLQRKCPVIYSPSEISNQVYNLWRGLCLD